MNKNNISTIISINKKKLLEELIDKTQWLKLSCDIIYSYYGINKPISNYKYNNLFYNNINIYNIIIN